MRAVVNDNLDIDWFNITIQDSEINIHNIPNNIQNKYKNDFYGLMLDIGVDEKYIPIHRIINKLKKNTDYSGFNNIKIINPEYLNNLVSMI